MGIIHIQHCPIPILWINELIYWLHYKRPANENLYWHIMLQCTNEHDTTNYVFFIFAYQLVAVQLTPIQECMK